MTAKTILRGVKARDKLLSGMRVVSENVGITLGPKGRNVIIEKSFVPPKITKDGVSVVKEIELKDRIQNLGVHLLKEAAIKTNDRAGDGTTTTVVLGEAISREGAKAVTAGMNPMDIQRGIHKASSYIIDQIRKSAKKISSNEEIAQIATISSNGDFDIGSKISQAFERVGKDGIITVEEANKSDVFAIDVVKGMNLDRGYISPYFVTNTEKMSCELDNPYILLLDNKINSLQKILRLLEEVMQSSKPLLIIAEDIEGEALAALIVNKLRGGLKVAAIKSPGYGERKKLILEDISVLTGAKIYSEEIGNTIESMNISDLGMANRVSISKDETIIINGCGNKKAIKDRCAQIKFQISRSDSAYDIEKLEERLAKLSGGIAVLRVGGVTEVEVKEKKDRVEDAYNATKAAIEDGIVAGGGSAFMYLSNTLNNIKGNNIDENVGIEIVKRALLYPIKRIISNAGLESSLIVEKLLDKNNSSMTFDAQKSLVVDAFEEGIIDPAKVLINALQSASSVASLLITTESTICKASSDDLSKNNTNINNI